MAHHSTTIPGWPPDGAQDEETERLISELRAWDITYLSGGHTQPARSRIVISPPSPAELLRRLAACTESRVRNAGIALLLRHPELAQVVEEAIDGASEEDAAPIIVLALAALYLQRLWRTRLALAFGPLPWLPARQWKRFWTQWGLPSPALLHGEAGLRALQDFERSRRGLPLYFLGDWQQQVDQLLAQEWLKGPKTALPPPEPPPDDAAEEENAWMSMRPMVERGQIEQFLKRLDSEAHQAGRVYLVGGSVFVHGGLRGRTIDIDLVIEADTAAGEDALFSAIRRLKHQLQVNVELASPADFIPLPAGWHERAHWVGRYGQLEVFYFDWYSLALSKINRATERDIDDVLLLFQHGVIEREPLEAAYQEIKPQLGRGKYFNVDPDLYAAHYALALQRLSQP